MDPATDRVIDIRNIGFPANASLRFVWLAAADANSTGFLFDCRSTPPQCGGFVSFL
jgi:hypothetical protein